MSKRLHTLITFERQGRFDHDGNINACLINGRWKVPILSSRQLKHRTMIVFGTITVVTLQKGFSTLIIITIPKLNFLSIPMYEKDGL